MSLVVNANYQNGKMDKSNAINSIKKNIEEAEFNIKSEDGLAKVRDILFGAKVKEQNEKLDLVQQKFNQLAETFRAEAFARLSELEKSMRDEFKSVYAAQSEISLRISNLDSAKTSRKQLADLLHDCAAKLSEESMNKNA